MWRNPIQIAPRAAADESVSGCIPRPIEIGDRSRVDARTDPTRTRELEQMAEKAEAGDFYGRVGLLGRTFVDIETEAFALPS